MQVVPAGGSSSISVSFTPVLLGPGTRHKVECVCYALGFMSLDDEVSPPGWVGPRPLPVAGGTLPVTGLGLGRWQESFPGGGGACRTSPWEP